VKGGDNVQVSMVRDLAHVVDREKAKIGVFISLTEPTINELFEGKKPAIPLVDPTAFKQAKAEPRGKQEKLL